MFKITVKQVERTSQKEIIINCYEIDEEVLGIVEILKATEHILLGNQDGKTFRLSLKDIFYIESVDNKTFLYLKDNVYESKQKLYELEKILSYTRLFRCSKSMILNIGKIKSVAPSVNGRFEAKLSNGETVIISRQYVPDLKKKLGM